MRSWRSASSIARIASTRWPPKSWAAWFRCSRASCNAARARSIWGWRPKAGDGEDSASIRPITASELISLFFKFPPLTTAFRRTIQAWWSPCPTARRAASCCTAWKREPLEPRRLGHAKWLARTSDQFFDADAAAEPAAAVFTLTKSRKTWRTNASNSSAPFSTPSSDFW